MKKAGKKEFLNIAVPGDLHSQLKTIAEKNGQKLTWIVKTAIEAWIAKKMMYDLDNDNDV